MGEGESLVSGAESTGTEFDVGIVGEPQEGKIRKFRPSGL
jgi:hypothetical protein